MAHRRLTAAGYKFLSPLMTTGVLRGLTGETLARGATELSDFAAPLLQLIT
jgi:hypothetical protein